MKIFIKTLLLIGVVSIQPSKARHVCYKHVPGKCEEHKTVLATVNGKPEHVQLTLVKDCLKKVEVECKKKRKTKK